MNVAVLFRLLALEHYRAKLLENVVVTESGCWEWQKSTDGRYGQFYIGSIKFKAHVAAYLLWRGRTTRKWVLRHLCNNCLCCNYDHLKPGSESQNRCDTSHSGRLKGLTANQAKRAKQLIAKKHGDAEIARRIGCHRSTIQRIRVGKSRSSPKRNRSSENASAEKRSAV